VVQYVVGLQFDDNTAIEQQQAATDAVDTWTSVAGGAGGGGGGVQLSVL